MYRSTAYAGKNKINLIKLCSDTAISLARVDKQTGKASKSYRRACLQSIAARPYNVMNIKQLVVIKLRPLFAQ